MLNSRLFLKILTFLIPAIWDEKGIVSASSIQAQLALHIHPELLTASLLEGNAVKNINPDKWNRAINATYNRESFMLAPRE